MKMNTDVDFITLMYKVCLASRLATSTVKLSPAKLSEVQRSRAILKGVVAQSPIRELVPKILFQVWRASCTYTGPVLHLTLDCCTRKLKSFTELLQKG